MKITPIYDSYALANAPASFFTGIQTAINMLDAKFTANITVAISIDYAGNSPYLSGGLPNQNTSNANFINSATISYSTLRSDLLATSTIDKNSESLPNAASVNGQSTFTISSAQERLFGLLAANNTSTQNSPTPFIDGAVQIGTGFTGNSLISVALHEMTHALGRDNGASLDVFRFTSPKNRLFSNSNTSVPAYFSLDDGTTDLADYGQTSDPGDFLNPPASNRTPNDPFNENVGNLPHLTGMDVEEMNALGFGVNVAQNDFNADGQSDYLWSDNGVFTVWDSNADNTFHVTRNAFVGTVSPGWSLAGVGDFNGVGADGLIWHNGTTYSVWMSTINSFTPNYETFSVGSGWYLAGVGNFGPGLEDLIFQNGGTFTEWAFTAPGFLGNLFPNVYVGSVAPGWTLAAVGDFQGTGFDDLLWRNGTTFSEWQSNGNGFAPNAAVWSVGAGWNVVGVGDFFGFGDHDLVYENGGTFTIWRGNSLLGFVPNAFVGTIGTGWSVAAIGDFNGAGLDDILFRNTNGTFTEWQSNGNGFIPNVVVNSSVGTAWTLEYSPTGATGASGGPAGSTGATAPLVAAQTPVSPAGGAPSLLPTTIGGRNNTLFAAS